jgi:hypothetical protein
VGLERGPLSLVSTIEELLGRNSSGSGLENREYGRGNPLRSPRDTLYPQKLALTSPTSGGRSVSIVRLRTKATEFVLFCFWTKSKKPVIPCVTHHRQNSLGSSWLVVQWSRYFLVLNTKFYYQQSVLPMNLILSQFNPVNNFRIYICKIPFGVILPRATRPLR